MAYESSRPQCSSQLFSAPIAAGFSISSRLDRSTNLLLDFEPLANNIPADTPVNTYTDETPNAVGGYRVGVRRE